MKKEKEGYRCPECKHMNCERNLKICMECIQGDKFVYFQTSTVGFENKRTTN